MPKLFMSEVLREMTGEYRKGEGHSNEDPAAFRKRMIEDLEDAPDDQLLDALLPEKLQKYKTDAKDYEERSQRSQRMREKKVYAYTAQIGREQHNVPAEAKLLEGVVHDYLLNAGRQDLIDEYDKVMELSSETLEEAAKRIYDQDKSGDMDQDDALDAAIDEQHQGRYDRGAMLFKLLEPLKNLTPDSLEDLPDEEAEKNYAMYHAMLEVLLVVKDRLEYKGKEDSEIIFTEDQKREGESLLAFIEPLTRIEHQTDVISNPYYERLDTQAISKCLEVTSGSHELADAFKTGGETLQLLGGDLDRAVTDSREEAVRRVNAELRKRGFIPDTSFFTRITDAGVEERFYPEKTEGINYIYGGGRFFVEQYDRQVEFHVELDREHTGTQRNNVIQCEPTHKNALLRFKKMISKIGLGGRILYERLDGTRMKLNTPEDIEYIYNGGKVVVSTDREQMIMSVDSANNYKMSREYTQKNALLRARDWLNTRSMSPDNAEYTREDGRTVNLEDPKELQEFCAGMPVIVTYEDKQVRMTYDAAKGSVKAEYTARHQENRDMDAAADATERRWEAQNLYNELAEFSRDGLKAVDDQVKAADPALLKSSQQYKSLRSSLKALKELLEQNADEEPGSERAKENRRRLKEQAGQLFMDATSYLEYKGEGTTDYARRRVAAAKAARAYADKLRKNLDALVTVETLLQKADGKAALDTLLNKRNNTDEDKFLEAGKAFIAQEGNDAAKDRVADRLNNLLDCRQNDELYHKLDLDLPGSRRTPLSESAQRHAGELLGLLVLETLYRDDLKKCGADQAQKTPVTQLIENDKIAIDSVLGLITETPAFQQKLAGLTRAGLERLVTEPDHRGLNELAEAVRGQAVQKAADKAAQDVKKQNPKAVSK